MLLLRSPTLIFSFLFSIFSILLSILTFNISLNELKYPIQFLIILPPLNCILIFLIALVWIERRFRLTFVPFIFCFILLCLSIILTIVSNFYLKLSILFYFNMIFYLILSTLFFAIVLILLTLFLLNLIDQYKFKRMRNNEKRKSNKSSDTNISFHYDQYIIKSNENEFIIFISKYSNELLSNNLFYRLDDLVQINIHTILTLINTNQSILINENIFNMNIKQTNIEHIIYRINDYLIPTSISDYMLFLYKIVKDIQVYNHNRLFVNSIGEYGKMSMTIVCLELLYNHIINDNNDDIKQNLIERIFHYPLILKKSCHVCQILSKLRQTMLTSNENNFLQILFLHEFYARLKSPSYMQQIRNLSC